MKLTKFLRDALVSLAIAAALFVVLEGATRIFAPQNLRTTYLAGASLGLRDDVVGHVNQPNVHARVEGPEFSVEYKINEQGFRDRSVYSPQKPATVTRILLLGDSFTFGASNAYDDIWPVQVEKEMRDAGQNVELIKAGVPAFDTRTEALYLERIYDLYRPDIVVFVFLPNDLFTNQPISEGTETGTPDTPPKRDSGVRVASGKKSSLHTLTLLKRILMANDLAFTRLYMMTARRPYFASPPGKMLTEQFRDTSKLLSRAHRFCQQKGCEFLVLSIPQQFQVLAEARHVELEGIDPTRIDTEFKQFADNEGFRWIPVLDDLAEAYRQGKDLYFRFDGHLNRDGNQAVAATVTDKFLEILKLRQATRNTGVELR